MKRLAPPADFSLPPSFFLTGTSTGVGKTFVAALIISARRRAGLDCVGFKPLSSGGRDDARILHRANERSIPLDAVNPWWFRTPAAPWIAAKMSKREVPLAAIRQWAKRIGKSAATGPRGVIVEGVGGWRVPISKGYAVSDLARDLDLPVVVVAANRLGVLNHVRLTIESIASTGATCAAVILNAPERIATRGIAARVTTTNRRVLESFADMPRLLEFRHGQRKLISLL
ncbi:MAG TPA: dethiobiotin synthase [Chthoniobacteraceae bacterium]|nr:dethiobiotin synthase [Chthoniobacteraceae bacterium]